MNSVAELEVDVTPAAAANGDPCNVVMLIKPKAKRAADENNIKLHVTKKNRKNIQLDETMWTLCMQQTTTQSSPLKKTDASLTIDENEHEHKVASASCVYRECGERERCELCSATLVLTDEGFYACTNMQCGIIYTDMLDQGAEWRYYGADDNQSADPTRCGMPVNPLLKESSYGFKILRSGKSSSFDMAKIARYMDWQSMPYNEKALYEDFKRITIFAEQGGIPKLIIDDAMRYHSKFAEATSFRGLNRDGIIAATIYIAARTNGYPRTAKEIASIFHLDNTSATRGCRNAISIINDLEHDLSNEEKTPLGTTTPSSFIERYCSKLCINSELTDMCMFVANQIEMRNLIPENTPDSIAAGVVYFVAQECKLNVSKHNVQHVSQISQVTINKCFKKMLELKHLLLTPKMVEKYANM